MTPGFRNALRWLHIGLGAVILGTYVYSPWADVDAFRALVLWVAFPALGLSGLALWQWNRIARIFGRRGAPGARR